MKKIVLLLTIFCFLGCSDTDTLLENGILIGKFKEISPIEGASNIETTSQTLTYLSIGKTIAVDFTYKILSKNRLELSYICDECDETAPNIVPYRIIDQDTFEIGTIFTGTTRQLHTFERI